MSLRGCLSQSVGIARKFEEELYAHGRTFESSAGAQAFRKIDD